MTLSSLIDNQRLVNPHRIGIFRLPARDMMKTSFTLLKALLLSAVLMINGRTVGIAGDISEAVISVVGLDEQGKPDRQGIGVVVGKDGRILTTASLLANSQKGVIRTNRGAIHWISRVIYKDNLQDLMLIKVDVKNLPAAPLASDLRVRSSREFLVVRRGGDHHLVQKVERAGIYHFSPCLVLLKIKPEGENNEPGTPVFTEGGELAGLLHSPLGPSGGGANCQFFLLHNFAKLPLQQELPEEDDGRAEKSWKNHGSGTFGSFWAGVAVSLRQDWPKAEGEFSSSLASGESLSEAYYGRGVARFHRGNMNGALDDFLAATQKAPDYALAWLWAGRAWERRGDEVKAREAYQRAVDQAPDFSEAWFHFGALTYRAGDLPMAWEYLSKAHDDFPRAARRWWYLGQIAIAQQQPGEALKAFRRALELDDKFVPAYLEGGKVLLELGRPREAIKLLNISVQLEPKSSGGHYHLALAYLLSWNLGAAWEQYFTLQRLNPQLASHLVPLLERSH